MMKLTAIVGAVVALASTVDLASAAGPTASQLEARLARLNTRRLHIATDRPLYRPGETIWLRLFELRTAAPEGQVASHGATLKLLDPRGSKVVTQRLLVTAGQAASDIPLPADLAGGEYRILIASDLGGSVERSVLVSAYEPPQIKKDLEFARRAYGPGDEVRASLTVNRSTGEPATRARLTVIVSLDGRELLRTRHRADRRGRAELKFQLPPSIERGDGLLTVLIASGGVTESIQRRIPIVLKRLHLRFFPEGGDLIAGLPSRIYFLAETLLGEPADVSGRVVDETGAAVVAIRSLHQGKGRFQLESAVGRRYHVELDSPAGLTQRFELPQPQASGCALRVSDDYLSKRANLRLEVRCTQDEEVTVAAVLRERLLAHARADVRAGEPADLYLPVPHSAQGAVRVTLLGSGLQPLAERLVFRGLGRGARVTLSADSESYAPRDQARLKLEAKDSRGRPLKGSFAVAVVDDRLLNYADDRTGHILAALLLLPEMPGQRVSEPNFYFSDDALAPQAMDLLLGTKGWRTFGWQWAGR